MHGSNDSDRLMTIGEVASYTNTKLSWWYENWKRQGVPGFKIGQALRFKRADINHWLEGQRVAA